MVYISWMVLVTLLSLFSFSGVGTGRVRIPHADKGVHFTFYFMAVVLGVLALTEKRKSGTIAKGTILPMIVFSMGYGMFIELLQWIMPFDREADAWDILANTLGAIVGGLLIQRCGSLIDRLK